MELRVSATRQELTRLKNRVRMAVRGHRLLKDKRDQLMKEFMAIVHENQRLRSELERRLGVAYRSFGQARALLSPPVLEEALMASSGPEEVSISHRRIMNVVVPEMETGNPVMSGEASGRENPATSVRRVWAFHRTDSHPRHPIWMTLSKFPGILPLLVKLSEIERKSAFGR